MNTSTSPNTIYRFRSADALLDKYHELEKQAIYFASPDQLNDPMEGLRDIVWRGDRIVWENFFKHFVFCAHLSLLQFTKVRDSEELNPENIPILGKLDQFPTPQAQGLFDDIWKRFLNLPDISEILEELANTNRKIRYRELGLYLRFIHSILIDEIEESYIAHGLMPESTTPRPPGGLLTVQDKINLILILILRFNNAQIEEKANAVFQAAEKQHNGLRIALQLKNPTPPGIFRKNQQLVIYDFPMIYLNEVERLLWPNWYTACFMKNYHNSSMWAHYGDQHKGVCLIFESDKAIDGSNSLALHRLTNSIFIRVAFHKISYREKPGEVDFFQSIGNLPDNALKKLWFTDDKGNISESFPSNKDAWRQKYWAGFLRDITIKSKDWKYEQEYRLILAENLSRLDEEENRTLTYNFSSLKGIIFGINTPDEDKLRIIDIIQKKCEKNNRTDFKFYQAYYSPRNGDIRKHKIQVREAVVQLV